MPPRKKKQRVEQDDSSHEQAAPGTVQSESKQEASTSRRMERSQSRVAAVVEEEAPATEEANGEAVEHHASENDVYVIEDESGSEASRNTAEIVNQEEFMNDIDDENEQLTSESGSSASDADSDNDDILELNTLGDVLDEYAAMRDTAFINGLVPPPPYARDAQHGRLAFSNGGFRYLNAEEAAEADELSARARNARFLPIRRNLRDGNAGNGGDEVNRPRVMEVQRAPVVQNRLEHPRSTPQRRKLKAKEQRPAVDAPVPHSQDRETTVASGRRALAREAQEQANGHQESTGPSRARVPEGTDRQHQEAKRARREEPAPMVHALEQDEEMPAEGDVDLDIQEGGSPVEDEDSSVQWVSSDEDSSSSLEVVLQIFGSNHHDRSAEQNEDMPGPSGHLEAPGPSGVADMRGSTEDMDIEEEQGDEQNGQCQERECTPEEDRERNKREILLAQAAVQGNQQAGETDEATEPVPSSPAEKMREKVQLAVTNFEIEEEELAIQNGKQVKPADECEPQHYAFGANLGNGSFGSVFRAINTITGHKVACKRIFRNHEGKDYKTIIKNEMLLKQLNHPYIVKLYEVVDVPESPAVFFILELGERGNLSTHLGLEEAEAAPIFRKLVEGVRYLHSKNLVHRDIKSKNVILDRNYNPKLVDFGLCIRLLPTSWAKQKLGTATHQAPEMLREELVAYNREVDIWALGCVLFEMKFSSFPFYSTEKGSEEKLKDLATKIRAGNYTIPEDANVSTRFRNILKSMLTVDRNDRVNIDCLKNDRWFKRFKDTARFVSPRQRDEDHRPRDHILGTMERIYGINYDTAKEEVSAKTFGVNHGVYKLLCWKRLPMKPQKPLPVSCPPLSEFASNFRKTPPPETPEEQKPTSSAT